jgi:adenosylhomocysteine nucleosidase
VAPGGASIGTDTRWRSRWAAAATATGLRSVGGGLLDSAQVVAAVADKRALHVSSGAVAADMESYAVARVAAEAGVPFAAVRAIADPAERPLPRAVIGIIGPDGLPDIDRLILRLCLRPWEGPALFRLRRDTDAAVASLGRLLGSVGPAGLL